MDTLYLLDQGQRRRRYNSFSSSFDNTRIINRSLTPAHQQYQLPSNNQIWLSLQPRQKTVYFITSIYSPIVPCLWKLLQNHKGLHHQNRPRQFIRKKVSIVFASGKSGRNKWGNWKRLETVDILLRNFGLFNYHSCKNLCCDSREFIYWLYDGFTCHFGVTHLQTGDFV